MPYKFVYTYVREYYFKTRKGKAVYIFSSSRKHLFAKKSKVVSVLSVKGIERAEKIWVSVRQYFRSDRDCFTQKEYYISVESALNIIIQQ